MICIVKVLTEKNPCKKYFDLGKLLKLPLVQFFKTTAVLFNIEPSSILLRQEEVAVFPNCIEFIHFLINAVVSDKKVNFSRALFSYDVTPHSFYNNFTNSNLAEPGYFSCPIQRLRIGEQNDFAHLEPMKFF